MSEKITIAAADGTTDALLGRPEGGQGPGVLLFMDAIGLRPQIENMVDRIASWGYVVLAPNLFYRNGTPAELGPQRGPAQPGAREAFFATAGPLMQSLTPDKVVPDIAAYVEALRGIDGATEPFATVGYCMGAGLAMRAAGAHEAFRAVAGFHGGGLATDAPTSPHLAIGDSRAEFVFGHAKDDQSMPAPAIERLGAALEDAGLAFTNETYEGPHGYSMADTTMYHEDSAERSFVALKDLLTRTLPAA